MTHRIGPYGSHSLGVRPVNTQSPLKTSPFGRKIAALKRGRGELGQPQDHVERAQGAISRILFNIDEEPGERGVKERKFDDELDDAKGLIAQTTLAVLDLSYREFLSPLLLEQADKIEKSASFTSLTLPTQFEIRAKVIQITSNVQFSEELKMAELGILYYFLTMGRHIPNESEPSLLTMRLEALEAELRELKATHARNFKEVVSKLLPSGSTAYLQRVFVRMIFTPDGEFNLGGCYAVKALLNSRLNLSMTEEMRSQVLKVVERLVIDLEFLKLFQTTFQVDPEMQQLIFIDLKLPLSEPMHFVYVRWSMLTALFSVIGQVHESNCSAISMLMNLLSKDTSVLVGLMTEVLKSGHFSFEGVQIPILPLLASKRKYESDFSRAMTLEEARGLTPYRVAGSVLDASPNKREVAAHQKKRLEKWMEMDFRQNVGVAKEFFLSHKMSFLQQALLSIFQFVSINGRGERKDCETAKDRLFTQVMDYVKLEYEQDPINKLAHPFLGQEALHDYDDFVLNFNGLIVKLEDRLTSHFFLVDYQHWDHSVKDGWVVFEFHSQGFKFNGNLDDYKIFKDTRRLFHLSGGRFEPVDTLAAFVLLCREHMDALSDPHDAPLLKLGQKIIKDYFHDPRFIEDMANILAEANRLEGSTLDERDYLQSNSFFSIQDGGESGLTEGLHGFERLSFNAKQVNASSPRQFFERLCKGLKRQATLNPNIGELVLASFPEHAYNLKTTHLASYWDNPPISLDVRVVNRGKALMGSTLSVDQMKRVLSYTLGPEVAEECIPEDVNLEQLSAEDFRAEVMPILIDDEYASFDLNLNRVLQEFDSDHLLEHLPPILQGAGLDPNSLNVQDLCAYIGRSKKCRVYLNAYQGARLIQKALIACSPSTFVPLTTLEQSLCMCFVYPETIVLGNLNWVKGLTESTVYTYLVLVYDVVADTFVLSKRWKDVAEPLDGDLARQIYESTTLYLPRRVKKK
ncbi:hypothetical protein ACFLR2_00430 [Chlamydiota bacterium]